MDQIRETSEVGKTALLEMSKIKSTCCGILRLSEFRRIRIVYMCQLINTIVFLCLCSAIAIWFSSYLIVSSNELSLGSLV